MHSYTQHRRTVLGQLRSKLETFTQEEQVSCCSLEDVSILHHFFYQQTIISQESSSQKTITTLQKCFVFKKN